MCLLCATLAWQMAKKASIQAQRLGFNPDSAMSSLEFITSDNNTAKWGKPVQERSILNALAIYFCFLREKKVMIQYLYVQRIAVAVLCGNIESIAEKLRKIQDSWMKYILPLSSQGTYLPNLLFHVSPWGKEK